MTFSRFVTASLPAIGSHIKQLPCILLLHCLHFTGKQTLLHIVFSETQILPEIFQVIAQDRTRSVTLFS